MSPLALCLMISVAFTLSCAEEVTAPNLPPEDPRQARRIVGNVSAAAVLGSDGLVAVPNEKWDRIKMFYEAYAGVTTTDRRDPYRNNIANFALKPDLPKVVDETNETEEEIPMELLSPLEKFPVEDFALVMIMSGTSRPKAVIMDPTGTPWIVKPDTPLGNKGGLIQAITQYSIVVAEPGSEIPSEITIRPVILDAAAVLAEKKNSNYVSQPLTTSPLR